MRIGVGYVPKSYLGYGRMGTEMVAALRAAGVDVVPPDEPAPAVCWMTFPSHAGGRDLNQMLTCLTMWEGDALPEAFRDTLHNFDRVIVPSTENVELFGAYHPDVAYLPLGIDPLRWAPTPRATPTDEFVFLISGTGARKGIDVAYDAFRKVFGTGRWDPVPRLVIKGQRKEAARGDWASNGHLAGPSIRHITQRLTDEAEVALYASAHCYVQPSRGEGFGLRPLQAIAQGCPTILTDAHGHRAYAHLGIGIPATKAPAGKFIFGSAGNWWEPDLDATCDAMLDVYNHWESHHALALGAAAVAAEEFSWARAAEGLIDAHGADRLAAPFTPAGVHVPLDHAAYPMAVNKRITADIGGRRWDFDPDQTYQVPARVLNVMRRAGYALN